MMRAESLEKKTWYDPRSRLFFSLLSITQDHYPIIFPFFETTTVSYTHLQYRPIFTGLWLCTTNACLWFSFFLFIHTQNSLGEIAHTLSSYSSLLFFKYIFIDYKDPSRTFVVLTLRYSFFFFLQDETQVFFCIYWQYYNNKIE